MNDQPFDAFEVHKVAVYPDPSGGEYVETIDDAQAQAFADDEATSQMYTLYGHRSWPVDKPVPAVAMVEGLGLTALIDYETAEEALAMGRALAAGRVNVYDEVFYREEPDGA